MMKKLLFMCLVLLTVVMWAGCALADGNTKGVTIHAVDAARIGVELPDGALEIESRAFAGCPNLISINLPATITSISSDAFSGCEMLTATVEEGSYAHKWCADNNVHFKLK